MFHVQKHMFQVVIHKFQDVVHMFQALKHKNQRDRKTLECLAVFALILILEHAEIGLITALGDVIVFQSFQYSTAGLVGVGTVGEAAVFGEMEDFFEITCQFLGFHVEATKTLDARSINEPAPFLQRDHLRKGGGVLAGIVGIRDFSRTQIDTRDELIDKGRLPHPTITAKQSDLAGQ